MAECYASTTVNLATAFGFFPRMFSQKHIRGWKNRLLRKMLGMVPGDRREGLSDIWGEELLSLEKITSDFERQNTIGKTTNSAQAVDENDVTHAKMLEFEPLIEASGERNLRSINLKHGEFPNHCLAQTLWHQEHSNLCLI